MNKFRKFTETILSPATIAQLILTFDEAMDIDSASKKMAGI